MKTCFVLPTLLPSGGVAVAIEHARRLANDHGVDAELVVTSPAEARSRERNGVPVVQLADAMARRYDIGIATWWETVPALWQLDVARRVTLLQSFEQRFFDSDAPFERLSAEAMLALSLDFIAIAAWMRDLMSELRPEARCWVVRPGIDKQRFAAERDDRREGPLRVLVEGQPTLPFKGVGEAVEAVRRMSEPAHLTLVALDAAAAGELSADRVESGLDADRMAALYRDSDVLLKLSRVEGLGLAPIEAFHGGLPCVVTPFTGHAEYARHGDNALVVGFDDPAGTAAALVRLARDRDLLARLSAGARHTAASWPSGAESTRQLFEVLAELLRGDPPRADEPLLLRTLALGAELGRSRFEYLATTEQALGTAQDLVHELSSSRDECAERLDEARSELDRIRGSRIYRLGRVAKRATSVLRHR